MFVPGQPESAHDSRCTRCGIETLVPIRITRLERRPWRLLWDCAYCGRRSMRPVEPEIVGTLVEMFDVAYGSRLSLRELTDFRRLSRDHFEALIREQILDQA